MDPLNNSFVFSGEKESLVKFKEIFISNYLNFSEVEEMDSFFDESGNLILFFDSYESPTKFTTIAKKECSGLKIDFNCTLLVGWDLESYYTVYTFRNSNNKLTKYKLKQSHMDQVEIDDSGENFEFNGNSYTESDVPGVLFKDMIKYFYGDNILSFK